MMRRYRLTLFLLLVPLFATPVRAQTTKVVITITGLATLDDSTTTGSPKPKVLYLIDANHVPSMHHLMPHIGIILVEKDYQPKSLDKRTLHPVGDPASPSHHWVELSGAEHVSIKDGSTTRLAYSDTDYTGTPCFTTIPRSLYFLPRLSKVSRKQNGTLITASDLDPTYLNPKTADHRITAYMDMPFGFIETIVKSEVVWDFRASPQSFGSTHQQMIAAEVRWTFDIPVPTLILQTSRDGGAAVDFLELKADGGEIRLTIANAPNEPRDIGVKTLTGAQVSTLVPPVDAHFPLYYEFLKEDVKHDGKTPYVRMMPVVAGVCVNGRLSTDPCEIRKKVAIPSPDHCAPLSATPPPPLIGDINCGPDQTP